MAAAPADGPRLVDQRQQQLVGACAGRRGGRSAPSDALAAHARVRRAVEHELDADRPPGRSPAAGRSSAACGAAPGLRDRAWSRFVPSMSRRSVPVSGSRGRVGHHAILRADRAGGYDRPREPAPPRRPRRRRLSRRRPRARGRRGPRRSGRARRRRRVRHQQLDALPRRLRDPAGGDGRADHGRPVVSSARATALHIANHEPGIRRVLVRRGERSGARAARRRARGRDRRPRRDADAPGGHRWLGGRRCPGRGRDRARPEPHLPAARRRGRLRPRRRPVHRHEPRPGLPDRTRPAPGCRRHRRGARGHDRGHAAVIGKPVAAPARAGRRGGRASRAARR